jgi:hypothetical protein
MSLNERFESDMKTALKEGNALKLSVLRMLVTSVRKIQTDNNSKSVSEGDVLQILQRHMKQHKESIAQFESGNRKDLADKELAELKVLEAYMPEQLSEEELAAVVKEAIAESGAKTKAEMGRVMKLVMEKTKGRCDGKVISQLVLSSLQ